MEEADKQPPAIIMQKKPSILSASADEIEQGSESEMFSVAKFLSHLPSLKSKGYNEIISSIVSSLKDLDSFTKNLEQKVDSLLKSQQQEFVSSYANHMRSIQNQFEEKTTIIKQLQEKILYYQNEGQMSKLVSKVFFLEKESQDLYQKLQTKDKINKDLSLTILVQKDQLKRQEKKIKEFVREKNMASLREMEDHQNHQNNQEKDLPGGLFPTEVGKINKSLSVHQEISTQNNSVKGFLSNNLSLKSVTYEMNNKMLDFQARNDTVNFRLKKELHHLKHKNQKLVNFQSKVLNTKSELENFFVSIVEEIKREIKIRKKMNECSLEDFRKEDKLNLMIKILSNDQIIGYLYERIFQKPKQVKQPEEHEGVKRGSSKSHHFPKINFSLNYLKAE